MADEELVDDKLKEILAKTLEKDFKDQYIRGMIQGWKACAKVLYKKCSTLTSAKAIKDELKAEANKEYKDI